MFFEDFSVGQEMKTPARTVTECDRAVVRTTPDLAA
jgi:hypothetical protein